MRTHIYILLAISGILLFGNCNKKEGDTDSGKGTIVYEGVEYRLDRITQNTSQKDSYYIDEGVRLENYIRKLEFISSNNQNKVNISIFSKDETLTSGNYLMTNCTFNVLGKSIQSDIHLIKDSEEEDNFWHFSPGISLSFVKKSGNLFELEIKYIESEDFLDIKWTGIF